MIKIIQSRDEALKLGDQLSKERVMEDFDVGIAGSFVREESTKKTGVDIVLRLKADKEESKIGDIDVLEGIREFMAEYYHNKYEIYWLDMLETDEEDLLGYVNGLGLEYNENSLYVNLADEIVWCGREREEINNG